MDCPCIEYRVRSIAQDAENFNARLTLYEEKLRKEIGDDNFEELLIKSKEFMDFFNSWREKLEER